MKTIGCSLLSTHGRAAKSGEIYFVPARLWLDHNELKDVPYKWFGEHEQWTSKYFQKSYLVNGLRNAFRAWPHFLDFGARMVLLAVFPESQKALPLLVESKDDLEEVYQRLLVLAAPETIETYQQSVIPAFARLLDHAQDLSDEPWSMHFCDGWKSCSFGFDGIRPWEVFDQYPSEACWPDGRPGLDMEVQQAEQEAAARVPLESSFEPEPSWTFPPENSLICPMCEGSGVVQLLGIGPCGDCQQRGFIGTELPV